MTVKKKPDPVTPGYRLVRANVAFYQGLKAGAVGEVPAEIADQAIALGHAVEVTSLKARLNP